MDAFASYLPGILLAYGAFLIGMSSPGPNVLAVIGTSISLGRQPGTALALGIAFGSFCWALLTVIGLSALIATYTWALLVIKIVGGCYLLWLAIKAFRSAASAHDLQTSSFAAQEVSLRKFVWQGFLIQMTNPKAALTWIAIISLGISPGAPIWVGGIIVAGTAILSIVLHVLYAVAFSTPLMVKVYGKARRAIQVTLGLFFTLAGTKLLLTRM